MKEAKQVSVALENKPGRLAHWCQCLADRKVNIIALCVADCSDQGIVRMVVDKPDVVTKMLKDDCPMTWTVEDVVVEKLVNKPGALAALAAKLAKARVNIQYIYGSATGPGAKSNIVMRVSSVKRALSA